MSARPPMRSVARGDKQLRSYARPRGLRVHGPELVRGHSWRHPQYAWIVKDGRGASVEIRGIDWHDRVGVLDDYGRQIGDLSASLFDQLTSNLERTPRAGRTQLALNL